MTVYLRGTGYSAGDISTGAQVTQAQMDGNIVSYARNDQYTYLCQQLSQTSQYVIWKNNQTTTYGGFRLRNLDSTSGGYNIGVEWRWYGGNQVIEEPRGGSTGLITRTGTTYNSVYCGNNDEFRIYTSYVYSLGSHRAPVFYSSTSTSYYWNGNSTSDSMRVAGDIVEFYSDERLKDIEGPIPNAMDKLSSIQGFIYTPSEKGKELGYKDKLQAGVSAQKVEAVLPEIVRPAPVDANYKTVKYSRLVPLIIQAINELADEVDELEAKLLEVQ